MMPFLSSNSLPLQVQFTTTGSLIRVNGGTPTTYGVGTVADMGGLTLGNAANLTRAANVNCAGMIIYNSALSDADRALVENYLNTRVAIC